MDGDGQPPRVPAAPGPREGGLRHFRLRDEPFSDELDVRWFVEDAPENSLLSALLSALRAGHAVLKVTGPAGSGKTLLCRMLLSGVGPYYRTACLDNPSLTPLSLLRTLAEQLGAPAAVPAGLAQRQQHDMLLQALQTRLRSLAAQGQRVLVCVDEAQEMLPATLRMLDRFMDLAACGGRPPQLLLFGEGELDELLRHPAIRSLALRIDASWRMRRLGPRWLARYLSSRMAVAGHAGAPVFSMGARWLLLCRTRGVPARVNALARRALRQAAAAQRPRVDAWRMWQALTGTSHA